MRQPDRRISLLIVSLFVCFSSGCGGGGGLSTTPPNPTFSSLPSTAADEGAEYSYQPSATSPDGSAVTFSLGTAPIGAALSAGSISWTPTHDQSRIPNQFSLTATTAKGGSATQSWIVTPFGVVTVTAILTYWTPTGTIDKSRVWLANLPYPAALIPQSGGPLTRLEGATNPDGTFSIPHVPAGHYWLQLSPTQNFWTSSSAFDAGADIIGNPLATTTPTTTTINLSLSGIDPIEQGSFFDVSSNLPDLPAEILDYGLPGANTANVDLILNSNLDFSAINTLFIRQYEPLAPFGFIGSALTSSQTLSNVTIANGAVNNLSATLDKGVSSFVPLNITGSAWADAFQNTAPVAPTPLLTDFSLSVQPFIEKRVASPLSSPLGQDLILLARTGVTSQGFLVTRFSRNICPQSSGPIGASQANHGLSPILTDQDYSSLPYGDPYPTTWIRKFDYCEQATVDLPRPNSTVTDTFLLTAGQTTTLPTAPISPLVGAVQSPTINGRNLFESATLDTTSLNLAWSTPSGSKPVGYYVSTYVLVPALNGVLRYVLVGKFGTGKNSLNIPFITAGNTYVFLITASVDAGANLETSPYRSQLPIAYSAVVSAAITISPGTTPAPARAPE